MPPGRQRVLLGRGDARPGAAEAAVGVEEEAGSAETALEVAAAWAPVRSARQRRCEARRGGGAVEVEAEAGSAEVALEVDAAWAPARSARQ